MGFIWVIVAVAALLAGAWLLQRGLIYLPDRSRPPVPPGVQVIELVTTDGLELTAWLVPTESLPRRATIVVFPGNAGNRLGRLPLAQALAVRGFDVLLVDYRGYGGNPGRPSEQGLALDAAAAVEAMVAMGSERLVYFGESLGAGVAVTLATQTPPWALVLRSPFASLAAVGAVHYPFLPVRWLLWDHYPVVDQIDAAGAPVLVVAGTADGIVPADQSRRVYEQAAEPKQLLWVEGADHNDLALNHGPELIGGIEAFIAGLE